jgi:hypothetical protein
MFGARPSGRVTKKKVSDNQIVRMKTTVSDHGLFQRAWVGGWDNPPTIIIFKMARYVFRKAFSWTRMYSMIQRNRALLVPETKHAMDEDSSTDLRIVSY